VIEFLAGFLACVEGRLAFVVLAASLATR